jgi:hypothetical protein
MQGNTLSHCWGVRDHLGHTALEDAVRHGHVSIQVVKSLHSTYFCKPLISLICQHSAYCAVMVVC